MRKHQLPVAMCLIDSSTRDVNLHWRDMVRSHNGACKELDDVGTGGAIGINKRGSLPRRRWLPQLRLEVRREIGKIVGQRMRGENWKACREDARTGNFTAIHTPPQRKRVGSIR